MSVYVDSLQPCTVQRGSCFFKTGACHMFADSEPELHELAGKIGLKRSWFQQHRKLPHYDLAASKRELAVKAGALQVDRRFVSEFMKRSV